MNTYRELLPVAMDAVERASALMRHALPGVLTAKGDRDMASGADGIPLCGISLGLVHNRRPVLGVIELPYLGSRYTALESQGTYVDGQRASVSVTGSLAQAGVSIGDYAVGANAQEKNRLRFAVTQELAELAASVLRVRMNGSAATDLAWLAEGKLDASVTLSNNPWDTSAGVVIAREAGALVLDRDGTEHTLDSTATIACTPALAPHLISQEAAFRRRSAGPLITACQSSRRRSRA